MLSSVELSERNLEEGILWAINGAHVHLKTSQLLKISENQEVDSIIYDSEVVWTSLKLLRMRVHYEVT